MKHLLHSMIMFGLVFCGSIASAIDVRPVTTNTVVSAENPAAVLNINTATAEEIAKVLTGIGAKKAQSIVALRDQIGGFKHIEQLLDVKGIGQATLEKNRHLIGL